MEEKSETDLIEIGRRLKAIRLKLELSQEEFGGLLAGKGKKPISKTTISKYESGAMALSAKAKVEIFTTVGVRKEYLERGDEPMFNEELKSITAGEDEVSTVREAPTGFQRNAKSVGLPIDFHTNKGGTPFVELSEGKYVMFPHRVNKPARAGYLAGGFGDQEFVDSLEVYPAVVAEMHKGYYLWFDITGDSMNDGSIRSIPDKSLVLGRQISRMLWRSKFHLRDFPFYVIVHRTEGIICKEIVEHDTDKGIIHCHSLNPNKTMYRDYAVNLDDCLQIFNVVKKELPGNI